MAPGESCNSLLAALEVLAHDPLISWALVGLSENKQEKRRLLAVKKLKGMARPHQEQAKH